LLGLLKRHEVQVLRRAGHSQAEVSRLTGVSLSEIRRIESEGPVESHDDAAERRRRGIGRPSKAEPLRAFVVARLAESPKASSMDLLAGAKLAGYQGSKSAFYAMVARLRPEVTRAAPAVGDVAGDASQHGFGEIDVRFASGRLERVFFFVSQLTYSRWSETMLVRDRGIESLLRALVQHFARIGGVPLVAIFDRHNASAVVSNVDGGAGPWNAAFVQTIMDLGIGVDLRGRGPNERSGSSVEKLVRWVKASFFGSRKFADASVLQASLDQWNLEMNTSTAARSTGVVPAERMTEERVRLRPLALRAEEFAPRIPVFVGPGAEVIYEGVSYPMPAETLGKRAMLYLHPSRIRVVGPGFDIDHERVAAPPSSEFSE
jgi:transposase